MLDLRYASFAFKMRIICLCFQESSHNSEVDESILLKPCVRKKILLTHTREQTS